MDIVAILFFTNEKLPKMQLKIWKWSAFGGFQLPKRREKEE